jgi:hypothetical protein
MPLAVISIAIVPPQICHDFGYAAPIIVEKPNSRIAIRVHKPTDPAGLVVVVDILLIPRQRFSAYRTDAVLICVHLGHVRLSYAIHRLKPDIAAGPWMFPMPITGPP